jgi:hypothetical protein
LEQWATSPKHQVQSIKFARTRLISRNTNNKDNNKTKQNGKQPGETVEAFRRSKAQGAKLRRATPRGAQDRFNPKMD